MNTYIIKLWLYGTSKWDDPPAQILGPFTERDAKRTVSKLDCAFTVERISTRVPEWATREVTVES